MATQVTNKRNNKRKLFKDSYDKKTTFGHLFAPLMIEKGGYIYNVYIYE